MCVLLAALGMVLVSGVLDGSGLNDGAMNGIALALGSAGAPQCGQLTACMLPPASVFVPVGRTRSHS